MLVYPGSSRSCVRMIGILRLVENSRTVLEVESKLTRSISQGSPGIGSPTDKKPSKKEKNKDVEPEPEITPLVKMLQNAGPIRKDGSDKFFGLENVSHRLVATGNT